MKTRFKIGIVIICFIVFYLALIPSFEICRDLGSDCSIFNELLSLTRPVIHSSDAFWSEDGISEWSGTAQAKEEHPPLRSYLSWNLPFIVSMIVLPFVIIGFVVVWDKRK